ncbi:hypothetical protein JR316_0013377 [Psilocybe cubensis]|uniref:Uncharacterized protein n=1 Tax=Psilocybe cubensis TaxID=181762 RepID=A0ACB8GH39_PSICU|nr:hypothetical protein JR316_0013377 [Psilocybe cubensis]KAH9474909.1 hypothetical protein JR316_0013377 [Psilocybe cubensis]
MEWSGRLDSDDDDDDEDDGVRFLHRDQELVEEVGLGSTDANSDADADADVDSNVEERRG